MLLKRHRVLEFILLSFFVLLHISCDNTLLKKELFPMPDDIKERVVYFAKKYTEADTEYEWGGNDALRAIKIDCSGLVVMCYKYALVHTEYELPFWDSTVNDMHTNWTIATQNPSPGDLIFMGDANSNTLTHMAIFIKQEDGNIYFIDSTQKDFNGEEYIINGATERQYSEGDPRFKSYGVMLVRKTH